MNANQSAETLAARYAIEGTDENKAAVLSAVRSSPFLKTRVMEDTMNDTKENGTENVMPFEEAERIVIQQALKVHNDMQAAGHRPYIGFSLYAGKPQWFIQHKVTSPNKGEGPTLAEALANLPPIPTPEQEREKQLAYHRNEIAKLEGGAK